MNEQFRRAIEQHTSDDPKQGYTQPASARQATKPAPREQLSAAALARAIERHTADDPPTSRPFGTSRQATNTRNVVDALADRLDSSDPANMMSIRVLWQSFLVGVGVALALAYMGLESIAGPASIVAWIGAYLVIGTDPGLVLYCEECGKRVKMGHRTCHHCAHRH